MAKTIWDGKDVYERENSVDNCYNGCKNRTQFHFFNGRRQFPTELKQLQLNGHQGPIVQNTISTNLGLPVYVLFLVSFILEEKSSPDFTA